MIASSYFYNSRGTTADATDATDGFCIRSCALSCTSSRAPDESRKPPPSVAERLLARVPRGRITTNEDGDVIEEMQGWLCEEHGIIPIGTSNPPDRNGTYHCPTCGKPAKLGVVETINLSGLKRYSDRVISDHPKDPVP